jgi:hypothetical protein
VGLRASSWLPLNGNPVDIVDCARIEVCCILLHGELVGRSVEMRESHALDRGHHAWNQLGAAKPGLADGHRLCLLVRVE